MMLELLLRIIILPPVVRPPLDAYPLAGLLTFDLYRSAVGYKYIGSASAKCQNQNHQRSKSHLLPLSLVSTCAFISEDLRR